jgi:hypothetical protein
VLCCNPTLKQCEDETHILEIGTWESSRTPETSDFDYKGQIFLHWGVLYIIEKLPKCRCQKWARMGHLDICNTSYGKKKGHESNWQFDSRPLKVKNQPDPGACRCNAIHLGKLSRRATSLLEASSQSELWAKSYDLVNSRKSKPG